MSGPATRTPESPSGHAAAALVLRRRIELGQHLPFQPGPGQHLGDPKGLPRAVRLPFSLPSRHRKHAACLWGPYSFPWPSNSPSRWMRRPRAPTASGEQARSNGSSAPTSPNWSPATSRSSPSNSGCSASSGSARRWSGFSPAVTTAGVSRESSVPTRTADRNTFATMMNVKPPAAPPSLSSTRARTA